MKIFQLINDSAKPLKVIQKCNTRWISIEPAVGRIITQWLELKTHFQISAQQWHCYTAQMVQCIMMNKFEHIYYLLSRFEKK